MAALAKRVPAKSIFGGLTAAAAWLAVLVQWALTTESFVNFLSYFTILCNLAIAVSLTLALGWPASAPGRYFSRAGVQAAIALYIFIVGLVYNTVLRSLQAFTGWQWLVDNALHVGVPALYVLYWLLFAPRGSLAWRHVWSWLGFPAAYLAYSLLRGPVAHWYAYPFLNAPRIGYARVFGNIGLMLACFLLAGLAFVALNRSLKKSQDKGLT